MNDKIHACVNGLPPQGITCHPQTQLHQNPLNIDTNPRETKELAGKPHSDNQWGMHVKRNKKGQQSKKTGSVKGEIKKEGRRFTFGWAVMNLWS